MGAKIFLIDDDARIRRFMRISLREEGHEISLEAATRKEAIEKIATAKELGVDIAIVDGSMGTSAYIGEDGKEVSSAIKANAPEITVISFSGQQQNWGHHNLLKPDDLTNGRLSETINKIMLQPAISKNGGIQ